VTVLPGRPAAATPPAPCGPAGLSSREHAPDADPGRASRPGHTRCRGRGASAPRLLCGIALLALCAALAGCGAWTDEREKTFGFDFPPPADGEGPSAIVFFVDGVNAQVFDAMLEAGRLPMIRKYFVDRGLYTTRCVANIPSVTLANETSFVTGRFPGRHGVTGINWFDRNRLIWRDYETIDQKNTLDGDYLAPTIYERLDGATTMSLFFQAHRGATKFAENWTSAGPPYFFGWYDLVDRLSLLRFHIAASVARQRGAFPAFVIAYMLWPDMEAYRSGVSTEAYERALEHTDAQIGRVLRDLESAGRLDRTVIVFATDHGMTDVEQHMDIERFMRDDVGVALAERRLWEETTFEDRLAYYGRYACVLAGSGDRYWGIYLRKPKAGAAEDANPAFENWLVRPSPDDLRAYPTRGGGRVDLLRRLRDAEGVDVVAWRAGRDRIHLANARGTAEITRSLRGQESSTMLRQLWSGHLLDEVYAYRVLQGEDPLGYADALPPNMVLGEPHDARAWLDATVDTAYPDLVPQLAAYFEAPRAGDMAIFASPGWDFGRKHKAGHGGLRPVEMLTPLLMAGPGVPHGRRTEPVRAVDVTPTLLDLLGRPVPTDVDGRSIVADR